MCGEALPRHGAGRDLPRWFEFVIVLGLYLTLRGYHSFDGDQSYRLPLLLHQQDPTVFAGDPFVRAFDAFNPHRGSLLALDLATRPLGLSAGLFLIFVLTFGATCVGIDRLARGVWPEAGSQVGLVAVGLLLTAKAGNIGTGTSLFEAMVLDRLMAFALGWLAFAEVMVRPGRGQWRAMTAIAVATLVHPSVGLQLALALAASWMVWGLFGRWMEVSPGDAIRGIAQLAIAVIPGLVVNLGPGGSLRGNMPADVFWLLSVELQSPQHMLPHLWRMPQWLAWSCYLVLAALALAGRCSRSGADSQTGSATALAPVPLRWPAARWRLTAVLAVVLVGLAAAWYAIEMRHHVRVTVFQPFRMATLVRGIALVFVAGRLTELWRSGVWLGRMRSILIAVAFTGDWLLVVVTSAEVAVSATEAIRRRLSGGAHWRFADSVVLLATLAQGLNFLGHHDTEYGHIPLLAAIGVGVLSGWIARIRASVDRGRNDRAWTVGLPHLVGPFKINVSTLMMAALAWVVPLASLLATAVPPDRALSRHALVQGLINRCRFAAVPADDIERLGLWCREHTPATARFIGPPGPKTFRLWSRRNLAFNRAASPYHANGLADWFARFQDHVDFHGSPAQFVRSYVSDRHGFEARYQSLSKVDQAALALRQGATYVVAAAPGDRIQEPTSHRSAGPLELMHVEGHYAAYRVKAEELVQRQR